MKLIVAATGASGVRLTERLIDALPNTVDPYVVFSENANLVREKEEGLTPFRNDDIAAPIASGSFSADAMLILPCSMNTLAKIAVGIGDNLTTRAAAVMLKERKKLILAPREMPYSSIALENMLKLSQQGVIIAPPVLGYYSEPKNLEQMEDFLIGKWFDLLQIEHELYRRWEG